jgi:hypothetical protein
MNLQWKRSAVVPNGIERTFNKNKEGFKEYMPAVFSSIQTGNSVSSTEEN